MPEGNTGTFSGGVTTDGSSGSVIVIETGVTSAGNVFNVLSAINNFRDAEDYNAHVGFSDTAVNTASAMVSRTPGHKPRAMIRHTDFNHTFADLAYTVPVAGDVYMRLRLMPSSKKLEVTEMLGGATKAVTANSNWNGSVRVVVGALKQANGAVERRTRTRNKVLIVCRGDPTADEIVTMTALLKEA